VIIAALSPVHVRQQGRIVHFQFDDCVRMGLHHAAQAHGVVAGQDFGKRPRRDDYRVAAPRLVAGNKDPSARGRIGINR